MSKSNLPYWLEHRGHKINPCKCGKIPIVNCSGAMMNRISCPSCEAYVNFNTLELSVEQWNKTKAATVI